MPTNFDKLTEHGLQLFPVRAGEKRPQIKGWQGAATDDLNKLRHMASQYPLCNWGVVTGNGLMVVDIDPRNGGSVDNLREWLKDKCQQTYTVQTPSGGTHHYFRYPSNKKPPNGAHKLGQGIDAKCTGGYVVAEGSILKNGHGYVGNDMPIMTLTDEEADMLNEFSAQVKKKVSKVNAGGRNNYLVREGGKLRRQGLGGQALDSALQKKNLTDCAPPLDENEVSTIAQSLMKYSATVQETTDIANAEVFAEHYKEQLVYVSEKNEYWEYSEGKWQPVGDARVEALVMQNLKDRFCDQEWNNLPPETALKRAKSAEKMQNVTRVKAIARLARGLMAKSNSKFDARPNWLNVKNGVINLETRELMPHDPSQLMTKQANVIFDPDATNQRFLQFIKEITLERNELGCCLQRLFGYCLSGNVSEQKFFIFHGKGANGKSVILELIHKVLGAYALTTSMNAFLYHFSSSASPEIVQLKGVRMASATEPAVGKGFNTSLLKQLTGGDEVNARLLYKNPVTFYPQAKLIFAANDLPEINEQDEGIWRRVQVIPFDAYFAEHQRDHDLVTKLTTEDAKSAILNWLLEGYQQWKQQGLNPPAIVRQATAQYRAEQDPVSQFVEDCCLLDKNHAEPLSSLYGLYSLWSSESNHDVVTKTQFTKRLTQLGFESVKMTNGIRGRKGLRLNCIHTDYR